MSFRSWITNCGVMQRLDETDTLFEANEDMPAGLMQVRLDRYMIMPMEEYRRLKLGCDGTLEGSVTPEMRFQDIAEIETDLIIKKLTEH